LARHRGLGAEPQGTRRRISVDFSVFFFPVPSKKQGDHFRGVFGRCQLEIRKKIIMKEGFSLGFWGREGARVVGSGRKDILPWVNLSVLKLTRPSSVGGFGCYLPKSGLI